MAQLCLTLTPPPDLRNHGNEGPPDHHLTGPRAGSSDGEGAPELTEVYPGYEGYIENGLICLKHKVRNLEKKKLKLEEYKMRLKQGHELNKDQLACVEKYEEVLHHLSLAQELHRTLDTLTQSLLRAQRKVVKRQQVQRAESERRRLCSVLQFQQVLRCLDRDQVQSDLLSGLNQAPKVPAQTLQSLRGLRVLLGLTRDHALSVSEQMERAAGLFQDLLYGKDTPVADSTFASLKEELRVLVLSPYFTSPPPEPERPKRSSPDTDGAYNSWLENGILGALTSEPQKSTRVESSKPQHQPDSESKVRTGAGSDSAAPKDQEPPERWDESPTAGKPWRGGAALVLKDQPGSRRPDECKRKERKARREEPFKACVDLQMSMEVLALPKDPELRRQRLEELLTNINGAFSFVQDSVLDGDCSPSTAHHRPRRASGCPSPLAQCDLRSPGDLLPKTLHSTPLPGRHCGPKPLIPNGDHSLDSTAEEADLGLVSSSETFPPLFCTDPSVSAIDHQRPLQSPVSVKPPLPRTPPAAQSFTTPPSKRGLPPAHFDNMHTVFKVNPALPPTVFSKAEHRPGFSSISTQTPPEFDTSDDESHEAPDYFVSPSQSGGSPAHYHRPMGADWSGLSLQSTMDFGPVDSAVDSGHGASLLDPALTSSGSVDASLLPHPLAPLEAPHVAPSLPLYPLRVAFTASRTANFAPRNLDQPILFDQLHSNVGETYDTRIGRFTCPADGTYVFHFHILKLAINVPLYINLMRNEEVMVSAYANDSAPDHKTASNHAILPLFRGDQVWLRLHRGAIYGSTWKFSTFSGFLLYQD